MEVPSCQERTREAGSGAQCPLTTNGGAPRACWQVGPPDRGPPEYLLPTPPKQEPRTACPRPQEHSRARPPCTTNGSAWSCVPSTPSTTSCSSSSSPRRLPTRSARGDRPPPSPPEKRGPQRPSHRPASPSEARAEPGVSEREPWPPAPICPHASAPAQAPPSLIWALLVPTPLQPPSFQFFSSSPCYTRPTLPLPLCCSPSSRGSPAPLGDVPSPTA